MRWIEERLRSHLRGWSFVDQIFRSASRWRWLLTLRLVRNPVVAVTLFHELGHIHRVQSPGHRDAEDVADEWAGKLLRQYARQRNRVLWLVVHVAGGRPTTSSPARPARTVK